MPLTGRKYFSSEAFLAASTMKVELLDLKSVGSET
jgi:hypothetical protein